MFNHRHSNSGSEIHVNPHRSKTPLNSPLTPATSNVFFDTSFSSSQNEHSFIATSETIVFNNVPRTPTPGRATPSSGNSKNQKRETDESTPLLDGRRESTVDFSEEDETEEKCSLSSSIRSLKFKSRKEIFNIGKILVLTALFFVCCVYIVSNPDVNTDHYNIALNKTYKLNSNHSYPMVAVKLYGPLLERESQNTSVKDEITVYLRDNKQVQNWTVPVDVELLNQNRAVKKEFYFDQAVTEGNVSLELWTNENSIIPLQLRIEFLSKELDHEVIYAAIVLGMVYILIIFEIVHRTLAAILGSLGALAILAALNKKPSLEMIISWLDIETLSLLFGMMIIVAILSETGFFDFCALQAYKLAKGKVWPLITLLCAFSCFVSAFLDNVTTILLLTPVTIRLCEVLNLDPKKILIAEVLFSNIGGTATAIGDPPNVIIVSDHNLKSKGLDFSNFTVHLIPGILLAAVVGYGMLRFFYRKMESLENKDPSEIRELKKEIQSWDRAAHRITVMTREESLMKALFLQRKVILENKLNRRIYQLKKTEKKDFRQSLKELEIQYKITDHVLLMKCGIVLVVVILVFFIHSFIPQMHVGLGWIAIFGAVWLLVLADLNELENILHQVEWATLIFFAALFTLMEALNELGLIDWIGDQVSEIIKAVDENHRLGVAILLILWISAIASSFIDNIPFTTAMVPVLVHLSNDKTLKLDLLPLIMALAFGACLGGNGTLIGASANVVCAGIAEQHGYGFTFKEFFKIGFPMMLITNLAATVYLVICHVGFKWHSF
ncbi:hypothetical protein CHS0354_006640 [Potamilus streckersoni]|uniref:Citrate transporter-like domain-containing protein n=1 Tax=Potamilus streckersoni TaxID=2493646 RepID=A0AAE0SWP1_9BIVA|nr:hypothetical protein CHS0354_006640 [Potamilus streckersoni]